MSNKQKKTLGIILCRNNSSRLKNKLKLKIGKKKFRIIFRKIDQM